MSITPGLIKSALMYYLLIHSFVFANDNANQISSNHQHENVTLDGDSSLHSSCWQGMQYEDDLGDCHFCHGVGESCTQHRECCVGDRMHCNNSTQQCDCDKGFVVSSLNGMCMHPTRMFHFALGLGATVMFFIFAGLAHFCRTHQDPNLYTFPELKPSSSPPTITVVSSVPPPPSIIRNSREMKASAPPSEDPPSYTAIYPPLARKNVTFADVDDARSSTITV